MAQSKTKQQATPAFQRVRSLRLGAELPPAEALHDVDHRRAQYAQRNLRNNKKLPSFQLGRTDTVAGLDLKTREEMAEWAADQPQEPATLGTRLDQMQDAFKLARQQSMARGVSVAAKTLVDVSGRTKSVRRFVGRKTVPSNHELAGSMVRSIMGLHGESHTLNSARSLPDAPSGPKKKTLRDHHLSALISTWMLHRQDPTRWFQDPNEHEATLETAQRKRTNTDYDHDDHIVLSQLTTATRDRCFVKGMVEPQHRSTAEDQPVLEGSEVLISALQIHPKDRQYEHLELIIEHLDSLTEEPFASMSEFEMLKAAMICEVVSVSHGTALMKCSQAPPKLFVLLQGQVAVFNFRTALKRFDNERRSALSILRSRASEADGAIDIDKFQEQWTDKYHQYFDQTWRLLDQAEADTLPPGTRQEQRLPGFVCGHKVIAAEEHFTDNTTAQPKTIVCNNKDSKSVFLVLTQANCEALAEIVHKDWAEKAQLLRNIRLTAGVSKLGIKMLAMHAQLQQIPPNHIIVPQDTQPSLVYVIQRGHIRMVKHVRPEPKKKEQNFTRQSANIEPPPWSSLTKEQKIEHMKKQKEKELLQSLYGQYLEIGLIGITQSFGAMQVLEPKCGISLPAYFISCRVCTVLTLSRNDMLRISAQDREIMSDNARASENFEKTNAEIAAAFLRGEQWVDYKNEQIERMIESKKSWRYDTLGPCFVNGPASSGIVRPHKPSDQPNLDQYKLRPHPFSTLGSVGIGLY